MDEKVLVNSKHGILTKIISFVILLMGIIALVLIWTIKMSNVYFYERVMAYGEWYVTFLSYAAMTVLPALVIAIVFFLVTATSKMTVTDKRVYGKTAFGKRVDLPLDSISAVATGMFKGLSVATSSGKIVFYDIANRGEMHKILSGLLIDRQKENSRSTVVKPEIHQSNADELKKYKDLLDGGIITQEEFDAKKKQLLGL